MNSPEQFTSPVAGLLPEPGWAAVLPFRIGHPTVEAPASPRRPVGEVIVGA
jgi:hypothetical protein